MWSGLFQTVLFRAILNQPFCAVLDNFGLLRTVSAQRPGLGRHSHALVYFGTINRPNQTILDHLQPFWTFLDYHGTILEHSGSFCTIWHYFRQFRTILTSFGSFQTFSGHFRLFRTILVHFGSFWAVLGYYKPFWAVLGGFGLFWTILGHFGL